ncbi:MAG: M20/M25/M40 family metallo-hydrolase [Gemmatimonadetes bacterium]|nr:M20/M25/M40 family metallo-hydrolase [Gemmatimonadota bacterium]
MRPIATRCPRVSPARIIALGIAAVCMATSVAAAQAVDPTAALLQELIRANSSNPPGVTQGIADVLAPKFKALGFKVHVIPTPDSGKVHFIARLRGDGSKKPVLLAAHVDVVGVEREKWTVDPFAGIIKDGAVYGRGAIDFKGGTAVFARAVMMLAENKVPLARDVIFLAEADEEGQPMNTNWLAREHWDKMDAEFALNEGGWIMKRADGSVRYVSISTLDKSSVSLTLTAYGTSTHSSMPLPDNAIFRLGRALAKVSEYRTPIELTPSTRQFYETLGKTTTDPMRQYFYDLVGNDPVKARAADLEISKNPLLHSIMRNTIAPVIIAGGFRSNVIPGSATATINIRTIPGTNVPALVEELERVIGDSLVVISQIGGQGGGRAGSGGGAAAPAAGRGGAQSSSENTELYRSLVREARAEYPGAEVTPYLFQAGTDAGAWRSRGIPVYGIYPYAISDDELSRMHGNDEQVTIESLRKGTQMIYRTILNVAKK